MIPFGQMNALVTFQRMMDDLLMGLYFVRIYLDDVDVFCRTAEGHVEHLRLVIERIEAHGLKLKILKCSFLQRRVKLLGHVIDSTGVHVDKGKNGALQSFPRPRSAT